MNIKPEILNALYSVGITDSEIADLFSRLQNNYQEWSNTVVVTDQKIEHNDIVRQGLLQTKANSEVQRDAALGFINKLTVQE